MIFTELHLLHSLLGLQWNFLLGAFFIVNTPVHFSVGWVKWSYCEPFIAKNDINCKKYDVLYSLRLMVICYGCLNKICFTYLHPSMKYLEHHWIILPYKPIVIWVWFVYKMYLHLFLLFVKLYKFPSLYHKQQPSAHL